MGVDSLSYARVATEHGPWWFAWSAHGVCMAANGAESRAGFLERLRAMGATECREAPADAMPDHADLRAVSGDFRRRVLAACGAIPSGEVRTYGELAAECGRPGAARAVGSAMARNPVPMLIPCHRVVRGDGSIGAYSAGGSEQKARMLEIEGVVVVEGRVRLGGAA
jgi:O-6-methylguanine DNA methyltransferase